MVKNKAEPLPPEREQHEQADPPDAPPAAGLWKKILWVRRHVSRVPRNGHNDFHNYDYATESDLIDNMRPLLDEAGLVMLFDVADEPVDVITAGKKRTVTVTTAKIVFTLLDPETGERHSATVYGRGEDEFDKGPYKAYTGAVKYFLMKTFLIPTGDDPERTERMEEEPARSAPRYHEDRPAAATVRRIDKKTLDQMVSDILAARDQLANCDLGAREFATLGTAVKVANDPDSPVEHLLEAKERVDLLVKKFLQAPEQPPVSREPGEEG